ncbi:16S rRNA (cytidine(1402)-2'-O)-methyltransferase [Muribaculum sp. An289]|uniref:Ribosomal RNA small subunit methyltransferase I n=1 Tax=Candidatus Merdivivens faecigallinarum TaxID=2840871 RepID=A0A9D9NQ28_9BACT|nr:MULTISPECIES: 16S rRNA (cytidine(1402)-2'-O)-methyltransferase [unclassified Muribaculum]MBO8481595.1 16S rRNA (cytidine(1402)-2'-O)-methyltransferase [Candidatus Merdivivens faecigallinarum]OUO38106.1 16S rRNA (cytidine(1402)-2'-O)-methyltransferase [Muribaculum sp. An289]OUO44240.1 16S rRNA (cytidine(1402)-2'-O)-methyltransferase [Muribaculum sp. An287]
MAKLYIVPTPIGNLSDMTYRAVEVLKNVGLILCEDTRTSQVLFRHYGIVAPKLESHHKFNEHKTAEYISDRIASGLDTALVSDAGMPGVSDPGFLLVRACVEKGVEVETLPGPCAFLPALVNSGFPLDRFVFEGFLPQKKGRSSRLAALKDEQRTMIFYESPYRLVKALSQMKEVFGEDRPASVSRELTKIHEETVRGTLAGLEAHFLENEPKGEIVIVVSGAPEPVKETGVSKNKYKTRD